MLAFIFVASALMKLKFYLLEDAWHLLVPAMRSPVLISGVIVFEFLIASAVWIRPTVRLGAWAAIVLGVAGNFVFAYGVRAHESVTCGCLGVQEFGVPEHITLTGCVFLLSAWTITDSSR